MASPSNSRSVGMATISRFILSSATIFLTTSHLLGVLLPEIGLAGWLILKSLLQTVATPLKCPGRTAALQPFGDALDFHPCIETAGVHLLR